MTKEEFIERHIAVCSRDNTQRPNGKRRGGRKRVHAKSLWKTCMDRGINPERVTYGKDIAQLIAMEVPA